MASINIDMKAVAAAHEQALQPGEAQNGLQAKSIAQHRGFERQDTVTLSTRGRIAEHGGRPDTGVKQTGTRVGSLIGSMRSLLGRIVKNYPPYAPDDAERVQFLRNYIALRKELDRLAFPPDETGAQPGPQMQRDIPSLSERASDAEVAAAYAYLGALPGADGEREALRTSELARRDLSGQGGNFSITTEPRLAFA